MPFSVFHQGPRLSLIQSPDVWLQSPPPRRHRLSVWQNRGDHVWIKQVLIKQEVLTAKVVEKDVIDWRKDTGMIARKDLVAVNALLFLNKTSVSGALPNDVDEKLDVALKFWQTICAIDGFGELEAKQKTVAGQPVMLKAIAKLVYDFAYGRYRDDGVTADHLLDRILSEVDFSHDNPMWRYYQLEIGQREKLCPGLAKYLPDESTGNRDIGAYLDETKVMRFGATFTRFLGT